MSKGYITTEEMFRRIGCGFPDRATFDEWADERTQHHLENRRSTPTYPRYGVLKYSAFERWLNRRAKRRLDVVLQAEIAWRREQRAKRAAIRAAAAQKAKIGSRLAEVGVTLRLLARGGASDAPINRGFRK
jgi:hypothetical protein